MCLDVKILAGAFVGMGVLHFARPGPFEKIVPRPLPAKRAFVHASGVAEVVVGGLMLHPSTRRTGGLGAVVLLGAVFPANVQMTIDAWRSRRATGWYRAATIARLPMQAPLIRIALKAARS